MIFRLAVIAWRFGGRIARVFSTLRFFYICFRIIDRVCRTMKESVGGNGSGISLPVRFL